jgi:lipid-A-disaccharide synthase
VIERTKMMKNGAMFRSRFGIAPDAPLLAVLPGSRTNEIRFILPVFREAVAKLAQRIPRFVTVLPTVPHVAESVRLATRDWPAPLTIVESEDEKFAAFNAANAALAASGTVTTELALARTPMVVAYRVGAITYLFARPLFRLPYFTLVNLLLERRAVPEYLQDQATPERLAKDVAALLTDEGAAASQRTDLDAAAALLGGRGDAPSLRAARALLGFVRERRAD